MNFAENQPIYRQIARRLEDEVVAGAYGEDERAPSVREYSALLGVNVNTVVKAYDTLAQDGTIQQRRGMGYYVTPGARQAILARRRDDFLSRRVPEFVSEMKRLGVGVADIKDAFERPDHLGTVRKEKAGQHTVIAERRDHLGEVAEDRPGQRPGAADTI
ncbi:MAG: GntR family transcriptional regulator [Bacteroidaceae bacterium]|nr:GntR family transcriptional regulator [Bacteroidaceae bacterium]